MSLPRRAIGRPVAVAMFFLAVVLLGGISFGRLPVDLLPDVAYPKLVIHTSYPDVAPAEVERFVTEPIEQRVQRVPGVERVESFTREGVSIVVLRFAWGTDMEFAALNVRERLDELRGLLPIGASRPVVLRTDPRSEPIMALSVAGTGDLWHVKELAENVFRRRLEQIDGIAHAAVTGGLEREIQIDIDAARLESYGLTIDDVTAALAAANASAPSGTIRRGRFRYSLRTLGELQNVAEIRDIALVQRVTAADRPDGRVLLGDVAAVVDGFRERESIARYNGREAVGLLVFKEADANTVRVTQEVETVLEQLRGGYPEVEIAVASSQAIFISQSIRSLVQNIVLGAVLAFLVLVLFLRDARFPIAIALAIPISVIATFGMLHAVGVTLNIMSLGGLALGIGMLVDNSIVVIENIFRHREKGLVAGAAAALGAEEVQRAITASTLTTIAVFGPIIYVEGVAGELFAALSFAVAFSLIASLVVAVTLLPTMAARWTARESAASPPAGGWRRLRWRLATPLRAFDHFFGRVMQGYERALLAALAHRGRVVLVALVLLALTLPFALSLERSVLPNVDQGAFRAHIELARGTPLEVTAEYAARLERMLGEDPDVAAVFSRIGRQGAVAGIDEEATGLHSALLDVRLHDGRRTTPVLERLRAQLGDFPPGSVALETGQATALGRLLGGGEADIAVRIRAEDYDAGLAYAGTVAQRLAGVSGLTNVRLGTELGQPEYLIELDRARAAAFGIEPRRVTETVERHMRGAVATEFADFDRRIPIVVRLPEHERRELATLDRLRVAGVPLSELVRVREAVGPVELQRIDQSRVLPVYADVTGGGIDRAVASVERAIAGVPPPPGMRVDIGGENEELRRSFRELAFAFALALLLVYMILAAQFESLVHPFTVLLSVPFALIGAILALWLTGAGLNTVSLIGIVMLIGIVDNDAIIKIDFINQMRREGMSVREAVIAAGRARFRPVIMNTLTTMLAITPMMIGLGTGAGLQAPLAIAVFGGLLTATVLTLLFIPVAYEVVDTVRNRVLGVAPIVAVPRPTPAAPEPERVIAGAPALSGE
jgi:hydrophobic/amphiphilic exporter-1 (mainly G- bacteria), HAE1 family